MPSVLHRDALQCVFACLKWRELLQCARVCRGWLAATAAHRPPHAISVRWKTQCCGPLSSLLRSPLRAHVAALREAER